MGSSLGVSFLYCVYENSGDKIIGFGAMTVLLQ